MSWHLKSNDKASALFGGSKLVRHLRATSLEACVVLDNGIFSSSHTGRSTPIAMPIQGRANTKTAPVRKLEFVVSTTSPKPSLADRKRIRSNALRNRARRCGREHKSWINPDLSWLPEKEPVPDPCSVAVPRSVCPDFALVHFAEPIQPYMLRDLFECKSITLLHTR